MKDNIRLMLILILMPWIITALGLLVVHFGEHIDQTLNQFFESLLKALFI